MSDGEVRYEGQPITLDTELTHFVVCVSLLVVTIQLHSRPLRCGEARSIRYRLGFTLLTLLLGWWALPWGPIRTIKAVRVNLTGGMSDTVKCYLWDMKQGASVVDDRAC
ncbi:MAG: hypothetical protein GY842_16410 [bacterium]|nr:hypothetical protein [bacterium]